MKLRLFAAAGLVSCAAFVASAAVVHKADESAVKGEVVALEGGKVVLATQAADGSEQRVSIPLEDVVEINFDPNAAAPTPSAPAAPPAAAPAADADGFVQIFNGKDLAGWEGDPRLWSVQDGVLVGETSKEKPGGSFLVYNASEVADFELRFSFKITAGNSGMMFRSRIADRLAWQVEGYCADIEISHAFTGVVFDEGGTLGPQGILAGQGQTVVWQADGAKRTEIATDPRTVRQSMNNMDWNEYVVRAEGNHVTLTVNGQQSADFTDERPQAPRSGVLAVQLYGIPCKIELKDVRLKHLGKAPPPAPVLAAAAPPAAPIPPASPRGDAKGVTAHFFLGQYWKSANPMAAAVSAPAAAPQGPENTAAPAPTEPLLVSAAPDAVVVLPSLTNDFGQGRPHPDIRADHVSVVFTGRVRTGPAGKYTFVGNTDDDHWLLVNGQLVCSDPGGHGPRDARQGHRPDTVVPVELAANTEYDLVFLVNESKQGFVATARWIPPGGNEPVDIPAENLLAQTGPPAAPTDIKGEAKEGAVTLSFKDVATSELRYTVERAAHDNADAATVVAQLPINAKGYTDTDVKPGQTYLYRVRAVNFDGGSAPAMVQVTVPGTRPGQAVAAAQPPAQRTNKPGVSAHFYNAAFWKSPRPAGGAIGAGRSPGDVPPDAARTGQDVLVVAGAPDVSKTLPNLNNHFGEESPAEGINKDVVSAAFSGRIRPKVSGEYTFLCRSDDDHWLLVDGKLVCSDPGAHGARDPREGSRPDTVVPIKLEAGRDYDFVFLVNEGLVDFVAIAQWVPPGETEPQDIPEDCLFADSGPPAAPTDLKVSATTDTGVTLSFKDVATSEIRYQIERATEPGFVNAVAAGVAPINAATFADKDLTPGVTYHYRVRAVNFEGSSAPVVVAATPGAPPGQRQGVAAARPAGGARAAAEPPAVPRGDKKGVTAQFFNDQYWRSPSPIVAGVRIRDNFDPPVDADAPAAPAPVVVTAAPDASTTLPSLNNNFAEAAPHPGINENDISAAFTGRIRPKETGEYTFVCTTDDDHWLYVDGKLVCSDPGPHSARDAREGAAPETIVPIKLEAGKDYDFVFLVNEGSRDFTCHAQWIPPGRGEPEEIPEDCLLAQTGAPAAPTDLRVAETTDTGVTLAFKDNSTSEVRFSVERDLTPEFLNPAPAGSVPINGTKFVDGDLRKGVTYYYRVRAVNFDGRSPPAIVAATPGVPVAQQQAVAAAAAKAATQPAAPQVVAAAPPAAAPRAPELKPDAEGFISLFNGKDLTGWDGDRALWRVQDGAITGEITPQTRGPGGTSTFLVWTGGEVKDFELRVTYKLVGTNSGVQYRSKLVDPKAWQVQGYQADMEDLGGRPLTGGLWEEKPPAARGNLAAIGERVTLRADGEKEVEQLVEPRDVLGVLNKGDWNELVITATGRKITHTVNGVAAVEVTDDSPAASLSGVVALQLDKYFVGTTQFKDVRLKPLDATGIAQFGSSRPAEAAMPPTPPAPPVALAPEPVPAPAPKPDAEGFITLFNGKDLAGWDGDKTRWTVEDGAITATTTDETRGESGVSTWLIWQGGEVRDFELRLKYKAVGVNSGINYRSIVVPNRDKWQVQGYQFDIEDVGRPEISGSLWDEPQGIGRGTLANVGETVRLTADGGREVESVGTTMQEVLAALNVGDWNEVVITAVGNTLTHTLNGIKTAEVVDEAEQAEKSGVLALQFDRWLVGSIQYKDIRLKPLGGTGIAKANPPPAMPPAAAGAAAAPGPTVPAPAVPAAARVPATAPAAGPTPAGAAAAPAALGLWTLQLNGGDRLSGGVTRWDGKELVVRSEAGEVTVPLRRLREAWRLGGPEGGGAKAGRAMVAPGTPEDTALVRADNDEVRAVRGVVLGADAESLAFRFNDRDRKIALDRLVGVVLGETDDAKADPFGGKFHQSVHFASGDSLSGVWVGMAAGLLELRTPWDAKVTVPVAGVARIKCRNGALVYLSDLAPAKVEQVPYFDRIPPYRLDASLTGGRLKLSDGEYDKGVAVHSRTVLHYDTGGTYGRFKGKVGFQEPEGKVGNATVRILGDGKPLFERPEAIGAKPPEAFDVDVTGVKTLTLEVDFGKGQDVGDRVVWANPRLIRARGE